MLDSKGHIILIDYGLSKQDVSNPTGAVMYCTMLYCTMLYCTALSGRGGQLAIHTLSACLSACLPVYLTVCVSVCLSGLAGSFYLCGFGYL